MGFVIAVVGIAVVGIGFVMIRRNGEASQTLRDLNPIAKGIYTPATTGCAGLMLMLFGIGFTVVGILWATGLLGS